MPSGSCPWHGGRRMAAQWLPGAESGLGALEDRPGVSDALTAPRARASALLQLLELHAGTGAVLEFPIGNAVTQADDHDRQREGAEGDMRVVKSFAHIKCE